MERVIEEILANHAQLPKQASQVAVGKFERGLKGCVNRRLPKGYDNSKCPGFIPRKSKIELILSAIRCGVQLWD
jgi:hypothetical protein